MLFLPKDRSIVECRLEIQKPKYGRALEVFLVALAYFLSNKESILYGCILLLSVHLAQQVCIVVLNSCACLTILTRTVAQPLQAYLMAHLITVFQYTNDTALRAGASYWSLRFVYLAIGVAAGYFIVGWASNSFSVVRQTFSLRR